MQTLLPSRQTPTTFLIYFPLTSINCTYHSPASFRYYEPCQHHVPWSQYPSQDRRMYPFERAQGQQRQDLKPRREQAKTLKHSYWKFKFDYTVTRLWLLYIVKIILSILSFKCILLKCILYFRQNKWNISKLILFVQRLDNYITVQF